MKDYIAKGGAEENTVGRKCLCNALMSNIGLGQVQKDGTHERPLVTSGDDLAVVKTLMDLHGRSYSALQVIDYLLSGVRVAVPVA